MEKASNMTTTFGRRRFIRLLIIVAVGILLSRLGNLLVTLAGIPIYLDCIGIILASAVGGIIPGIIVSFLSNLIGGISDITTIYYSSISVLIALAAAFFAGKGFFKRARGVFLSILCFALLGGGIGSVLTWLLYGQQLGSGTAGGFALTLYEHGLRSPFFAQFTADLLLDVVDKALTVFIVLLIIHFIPERIREALHYHSWAQAPLTAEERGKLHSRPTRGVSLQTKITVLLASAILFIAAIVTGFCFILYRGAMIEQETRMGRGVAETVASLIDPERVDEFIREGESAPGYPEIDKNLSYILQSSDDIAYIYVYQILPDGCHVVFDVDTADLEGAEPGAVVEFDESFADYLPALLDGKEIDPVISDDTYGWLMTIYRPLYNKDGVCQCYIGVDISMHHLRHTEMIFLTRVIALFFGFFVLVLVLGVYLAEYRLILPINSMALAAGAFAYDSEEARDKNVEELKRLNISTGDEIENLYNAFTKTTEETMSYVERSQEQNAKIAKMQNGLIFVLADLVESRDKNTGNHIRNTASYTRIILNELRREGLYPELLTDEFCDDVVNSAPLHDVGKIQVSDTILNKPGKLTDEEFAIMKTHAAAGGEIIEQAIAAVSEEDSGYLREAKNLASYHHEKWDGTGYPDGLKGEEIPLSARIMAVADVFDALVSRRSYKEGFPFEKAMSIIEEGAGTHFDPVIVEAFKNAEPEIREVCEASK